MQDEPSLLLCPLQKQQKTREAPAVDVSTKSRVHSTGVIKTSQSGATESLVVTLC